MSLLSLDRICRRHRQGPHERIVLREVSLELDRGELVTVWGQRLSGRSTLLRVAAGIEPPDSGVVRFEGHDLTRAAGDALGSGIGYCHRSARTVEARAILDALMVSQLARGIPPPTARKRSWAALERTGAGDCVSSSSHELDSAEALRVTLARALVLEPSLLVIDEPTEGIDLLERDPILALLRSLADEGTAILMATGESAALSGSDRALSLSGGELRGGAVPELAPVVPLRQHAQGNKQASA
ncbi:MAG TPA: ATP-binding cassette domain-containing protein [Solirubrobacteraceae bacterium]|jgi:ABC-type lipoprotein export system ATPase subunit|nr:ATP-binding cassette domain-containing protein [Solirubrobacteraceae bacterium]